MVVSWGSHTPKADTHIKSNIPKLITQIIPTCADNVVYLQTYTACFISLCRVIITLDLIQLWKYYTLIGFFGVRMDPGNCFELNVFLILTF